MKVTGGSGGRVIARQALFCREAVALALHADPERMGGLRDASAARPDPAPANLAAGVPAAFHHRAISTLAARVGRCVASRAPVVRCRYVPLHCLHNPLKEATFE